MKIRTKHTIPTPTPGRVVLFTTAAGDIYPSLVLCHRGDGFVDLVAFWGDMARHVAVPYNGSGEPGGWRYPEHSHDTIDV
jgi:hypothetical protein